MRNTFSETLYECAKADDAWWTMTNGKPELSYAYSGSTAKLRDYVTAMLAGREVVVTALKYRQLTLEPGGVVICMRCSSPRKLYVTSQ